MRKTCKLIFLIIISFISINIFAQQQDLGHYHRSSLYSIVLKHSNERQQYSTEIVDAFKKIPLPAEYNDLSLKHKVFPAPIIQKISKEYIEGISKDYIGQMLNKNKIGGRLVAKWFNRDNQTGAFNMNLIKESGLYDANISDIKLAMNSVRGKAQLEDAGESLIAHTYVLVNDIRYVDDELKKNLHGLGMILKGLIPGVGIFTLGGDIGKNINMVGFKVFVTSYLFRLDWTEEIAADFFTNLWMDENNLIPERKQEFDNKMGQYNLKYLGYTTVFSGETTYTGVNSEQDVFIKVCTRSIDKAISELQKSFDEFKVFTPLLSSSPLTAYIGVKEGVEESSTYEVLEKQLDENGRTHYERVGIIKPVKGKIWNNLYLSVEEGWDSANLGFTTFEKVSGGELLPGMLIREI